MQEQQEQQALEQRGPAVLPSRVQVLQAPGQPQAVVHPMQGQQEPGQQQAVESAQAAAVRRAPVRHSRQVLEQQEHPRAAGRRPEQLSARGTAAAPLASRSGR